MKANTGLDNGVAPGGRRQQPRPLRLHLLNSAICAMRDETTGLGIVQEFVDHGISGARVRRPTLEQMMAAARRGRFDLLLAWSCDRVARSVRHFLEVIDELNRLNVEFVFFREQLDTGGALRRAVVIIVSAIAELERSLIIERVRAGMRRARLEGRHIGPRSLDIDRAAVLWHREQGQSLGQIAKAFGISRASVARIVLKRRLEPLSHKGARSRSRRMAMGGGCPPAKG